MWLVLCDSTDASARWTHQGLLRRGLASVELVTSDDLAHARWFHHVIDGTERVEVGLRDGRVLHSDAVRGTLNRLIHPPPGDLLLIRTSDRGYVASERMAILMAWLGALAGRLLNPPSPQCLCGRVRSPVEWVWLAEKAGLPVSRYRLSSDDPSLPPSLTVRMTDPAPDLTTLLVVGDQVVGPELPAAIADGCRRLATLAHMPLLGLELTKDWKLAGVTGLPDLRPGGDAFIDALATSLGCEPGAQG